VGFTVDEGLLLVAELTGGLRFIVCAPEASLLSSLERFDIVEGIKLING
jgi:hypothetical protein